MDSSSSTTTHESQDTTDLLVAAQRSTSDGERELLEDVVARRFLSLTRSLVGRYRNRGADPDDLLGVANVALVGAMRRYDPEVGDFAAFASATITGEIKKYFRDRVWVVRPTRSVVEARARVQARRDEREQSGLATRDRDLADDLGMDVALVREARGIAHLYAMDSIDDADGAHSHRTVSIADEHDDFDHVDTVDVLARCACDLTERERHLLRLRFYDDLTQSEIGRVLGLSQMQVSRLLTQMLAKMRDRATAPVTAA